ncbi:TPA: SGNH/GDSL hydrolase family protein [Streptococcus suis]
MAYDFNSLTKQADESINRDKFYTDFEDVDPNVLHQISELTEWLRTKGKGSDVREVIAQLFERTWLENIKKGNANMEVAKARGTEETLSKRLDKIYVVATNSEIPLSRLSQEVKEAMTGGSVAVVGRDAVTSVNVVNNSLRLNDIKDVVFTGNQYNKNLHYIENTYFDTTGIKRTASGWGAAILPVKSDQTYSIQTADGIYNGTIGAIAFLDSQQSTIGYAYNKPVDGTYNGVGYITIKVPQNTAYVGITVVRPVAPALDNSENLIVVEGDVINVGNHKKTLLSIDGYDLPNKNFSNYTTKKWVFLGDSLTERNARATKFYHDYIIDELGIIGLNMGVSGSGYKRSESENRAFYQRIVNVPVDVDVLTIFGSFNDLGVSNLMLGNWNDSGTTTIAGCINTTLDTFFDQHPTTPVGLISPTPWNDINLSDPQTQQAKYVSLLEQIANNRGLPFLNLYKESGLRPWDTNFRQLMYSRDDGNGVHPDENGHKLIYPKIREFLKSLI